MTDDRHECRIYVIKDRVKQYLCKDGRELTPDPKKADIYALSNEQATAMLATNRHVEWL